MCTCINTTECVYFMILILWYGMYMCIVHHISVMRVAPVMPTHTWIDTTSIIKILLHYLSWDFYTGVKELGHLRSLLKWAEVSLTSRRLWMITMVLGGCERSYPNSTMIYVWSEPKIRLIFNTTSIFMCSQWTSDILCQGRFFGKARLFSSDFAQRKTVWCYPLQDTIVTPRTTT